MMTAEEQRQKSCESKTRRPDEATARATAMHMIETGVITGKKAWVYRCVFCRGWHITSKGNGANARAAAVTATDPWVPSVFAR